MTYNSAPTAMAHYSSPTPMVPISVPADAYQKSATAKDNNQRQTEKLKKEKHAKIALWIVASILLVIGLGALLGSLSYDDLLDSNTAGIVAGCVFLAFGFGTALTACGVRMGGGRRTPDFSGLGQDDSSADDSGDTGGLSSFDV